MPNQPQEVDTAHESATHNEPKPDNNPTAPAEPEAPAPASTSEPAAAPDAPSSKEDELEAQLAYENLKRRRAAKKRKRMIIIGVAALVGVIVALIFVMGQANNAQNAEGENKLVTAAVYKGDFETKITANGATEPVSSTMVTPEVDGIIENLSVQEGSNVNEGDVLFTLKNEELDKELRDANNGLTSAQRAVDSARNAVNDAYNAYNEAVDAYNESNGETEFDESTLNAGITSAEESYNTAAEALESARSKVSEAQAKADKRTVRAPVSGTVVSMTAKNGMGVGSSAGTSSNSNSSGSLMQISDLSQMKVTVQVNEVDISKIKENQEATATFSALPNVVLNAKVVRIASASTGASSESGGSGSSGSVVTYAVDLVIPEPDPNLKPGMTASVNIITQSAPDSLIVPSSALQDGENGSKCVQVVTNEEKQETKEVPVEVVMENSSEAAVKGELKDGDVVVIGSVDSSEGDDATTDAGI